MTPQDYNRHLALIRELYPGSAWIRVFERGYNAANILYLAHLIQQHNISTTYVVDEKISSPDVEDKLSDIAGTDKFITTQHQQLNKLFSERAKASNRFHIINTKRDRLANSKAIEQTQQQIASLMKSIDYYRLTGIRVENIKDTFSLPNDKWQLQRKINSIRSTISRVRSEINTTVKEYRVDAPAAERHALESKKDQLRKLLVQKLYAENKLNTL